MTQAVVPAAGGIYMMSAGRAAKDDVRDGPERENINTSDDARIPNLPVDDAETAEGEADVIEKRVIEKHVLEITGASATPNCPVMILTGPSSSTRSPCAAP